MMARGRNDWLTPFRRTRNTMYRGARLLGDVQPWLEGNPRKIVRRYANKAIGRALGRGAFGDGGGSSLLRGAVLWGIKALLGFGRQ